MFTIHVVLYGRAGGARHHRAKTTQVFFFLFHMFLLAMVAATIANSLGVQWVALEGTTLATTFLIAFFRQRESLEAGWKYLILCSVGIALALFGVVLTYYSSVRVLGDVSAALNITSLIGVADRLDSSRAQIGIYFYLGRIWHEGRISPDAYMVTGSLQRGAGSIAAMLAGVLETVAVYTIVRSKILVDQALPPEFSANLLMLFGFISFAVAAFFMLIQHNYKRLFAYSSIEHMGLVMIGFGIGGVAGHSARSFTCSITRWPKHWPSSRPAISIGDSILLKLTV